MAEHACPVIAELKSAPPRHIVNMNIKAIPTIEGQLAISKKIAVAQTQVAYQTALFFRTPAGQWHKVILALAVSGQWLRYAKVRSDGEHRRFSTPELIAALEDEKAQDEDSPRRSERLAEIKKQEEKKKEEEKEKEEQTWKVQGKKAKKAKKAAETKKPEVKKKPEVMPKLKLLPGQSGFRFAEKFVLEWSPIVNMYSEDFQNVFRNFLREFQAQHGLINISSPDQIYSAS